VDDKKLNVGDAAQRDFTVAPEMTAASLGNSGAEVLATPILAQYLELVAMDALAPALEPGEGSLGIAISIAHLAATPVGGVVHLRAEIAEINGRKVSFLLTANDDADLVATATHDRFVVSMDKFLQGVDAKRQKLGLGPENQLRGEG
jgi:predicted thioesterase